MSIKDLMFPYDCESCGTSASWDVNDKDEAPCSQCVLDNRSFFDNPDSDHASTEVAAIKLNLL